MAVSSIKFKIAVDTKELSSSLKSAQSAFQSTANSAKSSSSILSGLGNGFKGIGSAALNAVSKIGKLALSVTVFKAVNSSINLVTSSVSGAIKRIDTLNNSTRVFENMGYSADQSSKMMKNLVASIKGLPTGLDSAVQGVQLLAAATGNLDKSQKVFSAINNGILGFGGNADMVNNAIVQLSQSFSNGKVDAETWNSMINSGMGVALKALASNMGMTMGQLKSGLSDGTVSVEAFQDALIDLNENGSEKMASLKQIALDSTKGISTSFENMKTAVTRGVGEVIKGIDNLLKDLTGKGISDWIQLIGDQFEGKLNDIAGLLGKFADPIKDSFGTLEKVFNAIKGLAETTWSGISKSLETVGGQFGSVLGKLADLIVNNMDTIESVVSTTVEIVTGVMLGIGDAVDELLPFFDGLIKGIGDFINGIKDMLPEGTSLTDFVRGLTPLLLKALIGFKMLKGGIGLASGAFKTFNKVFEGITKFRTFISAVKGGARAFESLSPAAKVLASTFKVVGSAVKVLSSVFITAFKAIGTAVMAHPIIAAIVAIIAIIVLLWNKCEWFRDGVIAVWEYIKKAWIVGVKAIGEWMSNLGQTISEIWDAIKLIFQLAVLAIWTVAVNTFNSIVDGISAAMDWISGVIETTLLLIELVWTTVWNGIKDFFVGLWEGIKSVCSTAVTAIGDGISAAWDVIKAVTSAVWNGIKDFFVGLWNGIKAVFSTVVNAISSFISGAWNTIKSVTSTVWQWIWNFLKTVVTGWKNIITSVVNAIKAVISSVWNGIKAVTSSVWNGIKSVISGAINGAKSIVSSVVSSVKSTVSSVWNGIKSTTSSVWNGIKSAMTSPITAAKNTIAGIINRVKSLFNFKLKFPSVSIPHIPLPHFSISGSFNPLKGQLPKIGIDWYQTGGIFTGASVIGVGENGDEAVVPLSNKSRMAPFAKAVSDMMKDEDSGNTTNNLTTGNRKVVLEFPFIVNGKEFYRATVDDLEELLNKRERLENRRKGKK
ncbi:tape measure protein [Enterococcus gallinarum]|uniref:Tape measure protein n=1 Tax=Enterococcus gallinarum TaxID=1353 RepID=A0ABD4ZSZ0_ENTGA|nr:tape measure protein [Enterococcus gallinarum]MDL4875141.1 tape measure protein [Enterococcus gallinarum]MDL4880587.1 tape measure protein [Enterococcus gallinarum]MDL4884136.1 tape measure protein [Enterococcus gallinarum]MDL4892864.1 tape measure protein [Enterococcus gallinarum]MDL4920723.1 tape measure protein [Enterococcus gallinarum]